MSDFDMKHIREYNYLFGEIEATYHESSVRLGISDSVSKILYAICSNGDCYPLQEICRTTGLSKQTVNSAIRKLENDGIVYLQAIDRKAKRVYLTEKGKQFAEKTVMRLMKIENDIYSSWSKEDLQRYLQLTEQFLIALRENIKEL